MGDGGGQRRKISHMEGRRREEGRRKRRREGEKEGGGGRRRGRACCCCSVVKHELGKTAPTFTLFPVFLQLLLCGGGTLRELRHALTGHTQPHTHTLSGAEPHPPLAKGLLLFFLPSSFVLPGCSAVSEVRLRRANEAASSLTDTGGHVPTCQMQRQKTNTRQREPTPGVSISHRKPPV